IYTSRANLNPVLYEGLQPGGQLTITTEIENFPGYPQGVSGPEMMNQFREQAKRFGADIRSGFVKSIDFSKRPFMVNIDNGAQIEAETLVIATGASAKWLGIDSEKKFYGQGVSACATCDGYFYRKKDVAVVGGGDTACEEANYLSTLCNKVYLVHRRNELRASKTMQERVLNNPKIEMLWDSTIEEIVGSMDEGVTGIDLKNVKTGETYHKDLAGVFMAIGHKPNTDFLNNAITLDDKGYIKTFDGTSKTNIPGVFACGDVQDPNYRQAITAAGSGCKAAIDVEHFLQEN
ncbi:MAG: thioredoxin-disulfide reductase, partial [Bacteroidales bacterium]|nr:thioredoxin-disulfide reductase [Bacteroidales bacterium]